MVKKFCAIQIKIPNYGTSHSSNDFRGVENKLSQNIQKNTGDDKHEILVMCMFITRDTTPSISYSKVGDGFWHISIPHNP